ncbi:MAG: transposase [Desulfovibrio sp.]|nr:transposase [Desulfovibrio sp.]
MIREICLAGSVGIIRGHIFGGHVHLFVPIPLQVTISRLVQKLKGEKFLYIAPRLRTI